MNTSTSTRAGRHYATAFAERFDLRLPLVQAPMVGATTAALAVRAAFMDVSFSWMVCQAVPASCV